MSPESALLPRKWFAVAALAALALALATVLALWGRAERPEPPVKPPAKDGPGGEPQRTQPEIFLQQSAADGTPIPWGATAPGFFVRIAVHGASAESHAGVDFFLARDQAPAAKVDRAGFAASLSRLEPGRYRWSAVVHSKGEGNSVVLEPPRTDTAAADFVIAPAKLSLSELRQTQLDGSPIGKDLRARGGARLSGAMRYPEAVLEVEVKPVGQAFDGTDLLRESAGSKESAIVRFQGAGGPYHWRARATAQSQPATPWQEYPGTQPAHFIVFHPGAPQREDRHDPGGNATPETSSGGDGPSKPLPSIVQPLPSLWSLIASSKLLAVALAMLLAGAGWIAYRFRSGKPESR